jgi:hypothetical protein
MAARDAPITIPTIFVPTTVGSHTPWPRPLPGSRINRSRPASTVRAQELSHVSFDGFRPKLARDRYAVVAIVDEVNVTHLIDIDGGQPLSIQGGSIDVFPPPFESFVARQKGTGEFTVLPHTAYDPIQRDVLQSPLATGQQAQPFSHLFEG